MAPELFLTVTLINSESNETSNLISIYKFSYFPVPINFMRKLETCIRFSLGFYHEFYGTVPSPVAKQRLTPYISILYCAL